MSATISIVSIGKICGLLCVGIATVRRVAESLDITPTFVINEIPHYSESDVEAIATLIRERQK